MRVVAASTVLALALLHVGMALRADAVALASAPPCPEAAKLGGACARCVAAYCCAEITACYARTDCIDLNDCTVECGEERDPGACPGACAARHPTARAVFTAWSACAHQHCERECPRGEQD